VFGLHSTGGTCGRHIIGSTYFSLSYIGARDFGHWIDLWHTFSPQFESYFHVCAYFIIIFTADLLVISLRLRLVSGVYIAMVYVMLAVQ
jgi:hypothetical protein